jgi:hypothetical protein
MAKEIFRTFIEKDLIKKIKIQAIKDDKPLPVWVAEALKSKLENAQ